MYVCIKEGVLGDTMRERCGGTLQIELERQTPQNGMPVSFHSLTVKTNAKQMSLKTLAKCRERISSANVGR